ncbi:MAG TPA: DinB family protein [Hyphomicrobium sp.]|uniref:DinB family protein n=1 Tax=Hyphomicrobium sp. TaxID=82 RepID=UPI002C5C760A|nr:DinB family protein [Hyphomicrobium sp.]HXE02378.1 DinB family protein [Hyphomicrobium sp.]
MVFGLSRTRADVAPALVVTHVFNHQTHHRGQVHALLTDLGVKPGFTDLTFGPDLFAS